MSPLFSGFLPEVTKEQIEMELGELGQKLNLNNDSKILGSSGNGSSKVLFLGEAAGPNDAKNGEIFSGPYSQIFNNELLPSVGLTRQSIYLTNVVKNSQQLGQTLKTSEIQHWSQLIPLEIALIKPKLIVTMGRFAMEFFLPKAKISELRGQIFQISLFEDFQAPILFLIHPANSHRFPEQAKQISQEFAIIKDFLENKVTAKTVPQEFINQSDVADALF